MDGFGTIDYELWFEVVDCLGEIIVFECLDKGGEEIITPISYERHFQLCKWHFDVFGLIEKGLAIDYNTVKQEC